MKEYVYICSPKYVYKNIHSSAIHNSPTLEITQMPIQRWKGKINCGTVTNGICIVTRMDALQLREVTRMSLTSIMLR